MTKLTKTDIDPSEFEDQEPSFETRLEIFDPKRNHNKFWHIFVYGNHVVRHWGRHGSKGQWSVHRAWNDWGARNAAEDLVDQKERKGYRPEANILDRFARELD